MLNITVTMSEDFDQQHQIFVKSSSFTLELEHSLAGLSKWESIYKKPFLSSDKTPDELFEYVRIMCQTPDVPPEVFLKLSEDNIREINEYLEDPYTATTITEHAPSKGSGKIITAEIIYYWMVTFQIPFECQYWHLNKLMMLIRVVNLENSPKTPLPHADAMAQQRTLAAQRRKMYETPG